MLTGRFKFSKRCTVTNEEYAVFLTKDQKERYGSDELIQDSLPELNKEQREFLVSGYTPAEWKKMFQSKNLEP